MKAQYSEPFATVARKLGRRHYRRFGRENGPTNPAHLLLPTADTTCVPADQKSSADSETPAAFAGSCRRTACRKDRPFGRRWRSRDIADGKNATALCPPPDCNLSADRLCEGSL